jgi:hypothetical protein
MPLREEAEVGASEEIIVLGCFSGNSNIVDLRSSESFET